MLLLHLTGRKNEIMYLNYFSSKPIIFPLNLFEVSKFCESLTKAMDLSSRKIYVLKNYKKYMCIICNIFIMVHIMYAMQSPAPYFVG